MAKKVQPNKKDLRHFVDNRDFTGYSSNLIKRLQASSSDMEITKSLEFELWRIEKIIEIGVSNAQTDEVVIFINKLQVYANLSAGLTTLIARIKSTYDIFETPYVKEQRLLEIRRIEEQRLLEIRRIEEDHLLELLRIQQQRLLEIRRTEEERSRATKRHTIKKQRLLTIEGYPIEECPRCGKFICIISDTIPRYFNISDDRRCLRAHKCYRRGEDAFYKRYR